MRILLTLLCALFACVALAQPAQPDPQEKARLLFQAAESYYQAGEYQKALDAYQEVAALVEAPALLFNMAQCYRLLDRPREALESYRAFLEKVPDSPYRKEIEGRIRELEAALAPHPATAAVTLPEEPATEPPSLLLPGGLAALGLSLGLGALSLHRALTSEESVVGDERARVSAMNGLAIAADLSLAAAGLTLLRATLQRRAAP